MDTYTQLTQEERYQIHALKQTGHSQTEIAVMLGRHKSTISRELSRNQGMRGYRPQQAYSLALDPSSTVANLKLPFKGHYRAWEEVLAPRSSFTSRTDGGIPTLFYSTGWVKFERPF
jgi:hypothetical protein